ncbi:MAG TPA: hypothetical protein DCZ94_05545 [Lentisphaeria bacterium]|nr:hypothetical protein [Lentisphaeria bacterium]
MGPNILTGASSISMENEQEIALVDNLPSAASGQAEAVLEVSELVKQLEAPLLRYASRIVRDTEQAKDIVQEAFIKYVRISEEKDKDRIKNVPAWMYKITRNQCLDHLKSKRVKVEISADDSIANFAGTDAPPDRKLEREEAMSMVRRRIMQLDEREREIVILKLEHGKSYKEIAGIMDLSVTNVGFILHTTIKKLMKEFNAEAQSRKG